MQMNMDVGSSGSRGSMASMTSTSHLLSTRFRQASQKNKIIGSFVLTIALISGSIGFIHMYNKSNGDTFTPPELMEHGQSDSNNNVFLIRSEPNDQPQALARRDTTTLTPASGNSQAVVATNVTETSTVNSLSGGQRSRKRGEKVLPADASTRHPVSLIYEMKMEPAFVFTPCKDGNTTLGFKAELRVRTRTDVFMAYGANKKQAKRIAAEKACTSLWNFRYPFEDIPNIKDIQEGCSVTTI